MGLYQGFIETATGLPGNNTAIDFSNTDETAVVANDGNSANATDVTLSGTYTKETLGVDFFQGGSLMQNNPGGSFIPRTAVIAFRVSEFAEFAYVLDCGVGTDGFKKMLGIGVNTNGKLRIFAYENDDVYNSLQSIPANQIVYVAVRISNTGSKLIYGTSGNLNIESFDARFASRTNIQTSFGSDREQDSNFFKGTILTAMIADEIYTEEIMLDLINAIDVYGTMALTTSLESTRFQQVIALDEGRALVGNAASAVASSNVTIFVSANRGNLVEFFAFDTDENNTNLTTGPVVPSEQEPLVFNPVSGSGGGDPGTGLVAHIAGTVDIDGTAAERQVIVISDDPNGRQVLGEGMSAPDGTFDIEYNDWGGAVIALAVDNYGGNWAAETAIASGTIIHPTTPNGYVYEATSGGTTGSGEPTWSINGAVNDGSVTWSPRPFYRPIASGPIKGEVLQEGTPTEPEFKIIAIRLKDMYSQNPSQGYLNFSEIKLFDKDSNPIDLSGATAVASSSHPNGSFPPYQAIDGDAGTSWFNENGVLPVTFEIQLLEATTISAIRIDAGSADTHGARAPSAFDIEIIEEGGSNWILTNSYSGIDGNTTDGYYLGSQQDGVFSVTEPA